ncbi:hypothetical protein G6O69_00980 [Pseudenhygromyxa sp. WMMC2535]|uniref:hypothetical protein n=1 Tax=Pseudenhygromyxa sp. WMMC2535 TaxID=2712867 RepID=UPI00155618C6|nr:hypothetical protein [Pseudenhygromyxa sp. WMMC2535]NVB36384.1 hypothetical protein [Pseudenhygromyxa sp. WMMC2535]
MGAANTGGLIQRSCASCSVKPEEDTLARSTTLRRACSSCEAEGGAAADVLGP